MEGITFFSATLKAIFSQLSRLQFSNGQWLNTCEVLIALSLCVQPVPLFSRPCLLPYMLAPEDTWYQAPVHTACSHNKLITILIGQE